MIGKTHLATGLLVSVVALPFWLPNFTVTPIHPWLAIVLANPEPSLLWITVGTMASVIPDLDEFHSFATRKAEWIVRAILFLLFFWLCVKHTGLSALGIAVLFAGIATSLGGNFARKIAMLSISGLCVTLAFVEGFYGTMVIDGLLLLALWSAITAFVAHRTFTHSLFGFLLFAFGVEFSISSFPDHFLLYPLLLGYSIHLLADSISGGIAFFWPLRIGKRKRWGTKWVKSGGGLDHTVAALSLVATGIAAAMLR